MSAVVVICRIGGGRGGGETGEMEKALWSLLEGSRSRDCLAGCVEAAGEGVCRLDSAEWE